MKSTTVLLSSIIALIAAKKLEKKGSRSRRLRVGSLFSGIGGIELGIERACLSHDIPVEVAFFCESDPEKRKILKKHWKNVPIYTDIVELLSDENKSILSSIDVLSGGFPCQDVSTANVSTKKDKKGFFSGVRTSLYFVVSKMIDKIQTMNNGVPPVIMLENVSGFRGQGMHEGNISPLGALLVDLNMKNYVVEYQLIRSCDFNSPQLRERYFIVGYPCKQDYFDPTRLSKEEYDCYPTEHLSNFWNKDEPDMIVKRENSPTGYSKRYGMVGDAVVPQIAEWVFSQVIQSGALQSYAFAGNMAQPVFPFSFQDTQNVELDPTNKNSIPRKGALVWNFTVYPNVSVCLPEKKHPTMPTITSVSNMLSPIMQKHPLNKRARRKAGLVPDQKLNDRQLNINFIEWASGFPTDWTKQ